MKTKTIKPLPPVKRYDRVKSEVKMNTSRRDKYANDPEYRAMMLARAEKHRLAKAAAQGRTPTCDYNRKMRDYIASGLFARHGRIRVNNATGRKVQTMTTLEMSAVLGRSAELFNGWLRKGYILPPDLVVSSTRGPSFRAYSVPVARKVMLAVISVIRGPTGHLRACHCPQLNKLQGRTT